MAPETTAICRLRSRMVVDQCSRTGSAARGIADSDETPITDPVPSRNKDGPEAKGRSEPPPAAHGASRTWEAERPPSRPLSAISGLTRTPPTESPVVGVALMTFGGTRAGVQVRHHFHFFDQRGLRAALIGLAGVQILTGQHACLAASHRASALYTRQKLLQYTRDGD